MMNNRPNRRRPIPSQLLVLQKRELHSAAAEKVSGLEGVRETKAAT